MNEELFSSTKITLKLKQSHIRLSMIQSINSKKMCNGFLITFPVNISYISITRGIYSFRINAMLFITTELRGGFRN